MSIDPRSRPPLKRYLADGGGRVLRGYAGAVVDFIGAAGLYGTTSCPVESQSHPGPQ